MSFFLTLQSVQTLWDPKLIDGIKIELFGATTIRRKTILEDGLVAVDDGSGSGAAVGANDASLIVFEITSHYDYNHSGCTDFSSDFVKSSECSACKCQDCKTKHDGVLKAINVLTSSVKKMAFNRGFIPSKRISYPYTPLEIKVATRKRKDIFKASSREATAEEHNITVDNPSTDSKEEERIEPVCSRERKNYTFEGFNISNEDPKKLSQLFNDYSECIDDGMLKHHVCRDCGLFVFAYAKYLSDGLQVPNDGLDPGLLHKIYAALLWKYVEMKAQKPYASNVKYPRRPKPNFTDQIKNNLSILSRSL
ncbi:hypothetical protein BC332_10417 [Capsicum chinense]|nr:hypothetical protein BC332_10417 [Capsicum chinense]